jgi:hypothetical protein
MLAAGTYRRFPLLAAGALALVAALAYCPSAHAACGDYVTVVGAHRSADMPEVPAPVCQGPGCSKAPSQAAPVSAPKIMERPASSAVANADSVPPPLGTRRGPCVESLTPSSALPSDIFHPPRTV